MWKGNRFLFELENRNSIERKWKHVFRSKQRCITETAVSNWPRSIQQHQQQQKKQWQQQQQWQPQDQTRWTLQWNRVVHFTQKKLIFSHKTKRKFFLSKQKKPERRREPLKRQYSYKFDFQQYLYCILLHLKFLVTKIIT